MKPTRLGNPKRIWSKRPHLSSLLCPTIRLPFLSLSARTSSELLRDYYASIGGRDKMLEDAAKTLKAKKRGRPSTGTLNASNRKRSRKSHPMESQPPAVLEKTEEKWRPPTGSWENEVEVVDMFRENNGTLVVYLTWKNGHKSQHGVQQTYQHCPQKVLSLLFCLLSPSCTVC